MTLIAVGLAGVGVAATVVAMALGVLTKFVWAKLNAPPISPIVVFCSCTVAALVLVTVQLISDPAAVAAAFKTNVPADTFGVAVPPTPMPVQLTPVSV